MSKNMQQKLHSQGRRGARCHLAWSLVCTRMHLPHRCCIFGHFEPEERERIIRAMCPSGEDMGQVSIPVVVAWIKSLCAHA
jgi:hypothetical protein